MERIKNLDGYQKGILIVMMVMVILFLVDYARTTSRVGFEYQGKILAVSQENGSTVYSGKIAGQPARFTVSEDKTVVFRYGDRTYGPYTAKEDPTAIPRSNGMADYMVGVEVRKGDSVWFRGGVLEQDDSLLLFNEDGSSASIGGFIQFSDGTMKDENGNVIDPMEPSVATILRLMGDPELTHRGKWIGWFGGVFLCALNALTILFADELFRLDLMFRIRDAEYAEPSGWEIAGRYIAWTVMTGLALWIFVIGLQ